MKVEDESELKVKIESGSVQKVREIRRGGREYPPDLEQLYKPPAVLHAIGLSLTELTPRVAIVGSRRCTAYGRAMAQELAEELASLGIIIVSGLARGIDTAAHSGALKKGRTIGVLGCGLDQVYPPENKTLYDLIPKKGAIVSEYGFGMPPISYNFPARNRIISGLSAGVIVVEATLKSGALITADCALEQGKEVMVVPGHAKSPNSRGCHHLLKSGAALVDSADDVLEVLGLDRQKNSADRAAKLSAEENKLLELIDFEPVHMDQLANLSGESITHVAIIILQLEIKGYLKKEVGGEVIRMK